MRYTPNPERYNAIPYRRTGKSGVLLPVISLGLWHNFGAVDPFHTAREMLWCAFDHGITHFDLANNYGPPPGSAESTLGTVLRNDLLGWRDELFLSTKAGYTMWPGPYGDWGSRKYLISSLEQSLRRLGLEYVDLFYSHRYDPSTPLEETLGALDHAVRQGKALYAGISNYPPEPTDRACRMLSEMGTPCLIHQAAYSMFNRNPEAGLLDAVERNGIGLIAFSPLAQGLLTDKYLNGIPTNSRAVKSGVFLKPEMITEDKLARLHALQEMACARGQSLAQMALAWVLRDERVTSVLIGASSPEQVRDSLKAANSPAFAEAELAEIDCILAQEES